MWAAQKKGKSPVSFYKGDSGSNNTSGESSYDAGVDLFRLRDWSGRGYVSRIRVEVESKGKGK